MVVTDNHAVRFLRKPLFPLEAIPRVIFYPYDAFGIYGSVNSADRQEWGRQVKFGSGLQAVYLYSPGGVDIIPVLQIEGDMVYPSVFRSEK